MVFTIRGLVPYEAALPGFPRDPLIESARRNLTVSWPVHDVRLLDAARVLDAGNLDEARRAVVGVLAGDPESVDALNLMAQIEHHAGRNGEAETLLARCLEISPDHQAYRHNYVVLLSYMGKFDSALVEARKLLESEPANLLFRSLYADLLIQNKRYGEAVGCYRDLTADCPDSTELWHRLGSALRSIGGHTDDAIASFRRAVELAPGLGSIWWSLASLKTFTFSQNDIEAMEAELAGPPISSRDRADMHYALGKAYEDIKDYEKSFRHYTRGNAIRRIDLDYDADDTTDMVSRAKVVVTPELYHEKGRGGHASTEPIFVLGLQRAGSTLVEQILGSHPLMEAAGELQCLLRIVGDDVMPKTGPNYPSGIDRLSADDLKALGDKYLELSRVHRVQKRPFFIDKCPYNLWHVGLIHLMFPDARIIDVRRHPIGCCLANFTMSFAHAPPLSYRLTDIGRFYRDYVRLMAHFDRVAPGKVHRVFYEALVADLDGEVRRMLDYIGLPFEDACLEFYRNDRAFNSFSNEQVRRPIFTEALERWRPYEPWLGQLKASLGAVLDAYPDVPEFDD